MESAKRVLITGGSGMIGRRLTTLLQEKGYDVSHLGRSKRDNAVRSFIWDPTRNEIDRAALQNTDAIIHLAGAGIADKRWNKKRKEELLSSRIEPTRLLGDTLGKIDHRVRAFVSASGISYYGLGDAPLGGFIESNPPASDFLARLTVAWEKEVLVINDLSIRTVVIRPGAVLSKEGGALKELAWPVKFFVGAPLATGRQLINWIHVDDLCRIYIKAIEDPLMEGPFNAVAPNPVTNREFTTHLARVLKRPLWLPPVPGFVVKLIAGEVAEFVLKGAKVSCAKIERAGFEFKFRTVDRALQDLLP